MLGCTFVEVNKMMELRLSMTRGKFLVEYFMHQLKNNILQFLLLIIQVVYEMIGRGANFTKLFEESINEVHETIDYFIAIQDQIEVIQ